MNCIKISLFPVIMMKKFFHYNFYAFSIHYAKILMYVSKMELPQKYLFLSIGNYSQDFGTDSPV